MAVREKLFQHRLQANELGVLHVYQNGAARHVSPVTIMLQCGCTCKV